MTVEIRGTEDTGGEAEARVLKLLEEHAVQAGHAFAQTRLTFEAWRDDTYLGGLVSVILQDWMFVSFLAVAENARGQGIGRRLMDAAESAARANDATGIWLDTYSFQAPGFYERLGFRRIADLPDSPSGQNRYFYAKRLRP